MDRVPASEAPSQEVLETLRNLSTFHHRARAAHKTLLPRGERPVRRCTASIPRIAAALLALPALSLLSRAWHRRWGATEEEASGSLPGDSLVPDAHLQTTRAIEIEAPPSGVWPWLVQMGQGRGGLYTYEWIENLLGARIHNLDRIEPDLQGLKVGDRVRLTPEVYLGRVPGQYYRVQEVRPVEALTMLQQLPTGGLSSWSFTLRPAGAAGTRLIVRGRASARSGIVGRMVHQFELLLLEPGYFVMERGMLRGIRKRAEAAE